MAIRLAYGMPGSGKSTLLHALVQAQASTHRFLVCDHEAGWGPDSGHWLGGYPPPEVTIINAGDSPPPLDEWPPVGIFVFRNWEPRDVAELAAELGDAVYVDDEIDRAGRRKEFDDSALRAIVNEGRHLPNADGEPREVHLLGACRRPAKLHSDISELADEVYIFRSQGSRTLRRLQEDGMLDDMQGAEGDEQAAWALLRDFPVGRCLHYPSGEVFDVAPPRSKVGDGHS